MEKRIHAGGPILSGRSFMYMENLFRPLVHRFVLKEDIDPERLRSAVDHAVLTHPWAAYGICHEDGVFYYQDGPDKTIQVSEAEWEDLPPLGGTCAGGHLIGVYYKGRILTIPYYHGLTDGKGLFTFIEDLLRAYKGGDGAPVKSEAMIPDDLNAEPFEAVYGISEKPGLPPEGSDPETTQEKASFLMPERFEDGEAHPCHYMIKVNAADYMHFAKDCGAKPASLLVSLYARALAKAMDKAGQNIRVAIPMDYRKTLGIPNTFRNCALPPVMLDLAPEIVNADIRVLASHVQESISRMADPAAGVMAVKNIADLIGKIPPLPYRQGAELFSQFAGGPLFTFNVSYAYRAPQSDFASMLDSIYVTYPSDENNMMLILIALPDHFCITLNQGDCTPQYANALCQVLSENGISCEMQGVLYGNEGYIELREAGNW